MKIISAIATVGVALIATACGKSSESHSSTTTTYQVNGKTSDEYFKQFLYRETGACGSIHEAHHYPKSDSFRVGINREGKDILANLSLFMRDDGTYSAFYQEIVVFGYFDGGYYWDSHRERIISGRWVVNGERLVLSSLGQASALQYNGAPAMQLQMESDILSPGLNGRMLLIRRTEASYNPIPELDPCAHR